MLVASMVQMNPCAITLGECRETVFIYGRVYIGNV
jgi:hypothetical protein